MTLSALNGRDFFLILRVLAVELGPAAPTRNLGDIIDHPSQYLLLLPQNIAKIFHFLFILLLNIFLLKLQPDPLILRLEYLRL